MQPPNDIPALVKWSLQCIADIEGFETDAQFIADWTAWAEERGHRDWPDVEPTAWKTLDANADGRLIMTHEEMMRVIRGGSVPARRWTPKDNE